MSAPTYRMTVRNAPPGILLLRNGHAVFKTEYHDTATGSDELRPICYVVDSGERYHGEGYDVDCIDVTIDCTTAAKEKWEAP